MIRNLLLPITLMVLFTSAPLHAATARLERDTSLDGYLHADYFTVEFFVFERPAVLDFTTEEVLALDRPRALPRTLRSQRVDPEWRWPLALDPNTRARLTFPVITYELEPALEPRPDGGNPAASPPPSLEPSTTATETDTRSTVPVPEIAPVLESDPTLDFLAAMAAFESSLEAKLDRWQSEDAFTLRREAARIERRGFGRILFHGRWLQAVPPRDAPEPILITGGETLAGAVPELVGSVSITLGRFLHFQAELFFHGPALGAEPAAALMGADGSVRLSAPEFPGRRYMVLSESRRMRSSELHYLDHPKLGVVVRVEPVTYPDALLEAFDALEALEEGVE